LEDGSPTISLVPLATTKLGVLANLSLTVPDVGNVHFAQGAFGIRVGDKLYENPELLAVTSFTTPLLGDVIEYGESGAIEGRLNFGTDVLAERAESFVYFVETPRAAINIPAGEADIDPVTGQVTFSQADIVDFGGESTYFVEQLITEKRRDVVISPLQGSVYIKTPLQAMQVVEVAYYQADVAGQRLNDELHVEQLPLYIRQEVATFVSDRVWAINPTGRTIRPDVGFQVWVNNRLQSYGNLSTVSLVGNTLEFTFDVPLGSSVLVNYSVLEAFGGEQSYVVSLPPVWRPPFQLPKGATEFVLDTDRTSDMVAGKVLRLGAFPLYITGSTFDVSTNKTTVGVFPPPPVQLGSSSPGNDVLSVLTARPLTGGFMRNVSSGYEPVDKGRLFIVFLGDLRPFAFPGYLLEVGGYPHIVTSVDLSEDGITTKVGVSTPFERSFVLGVDSVSLSARPIYPPDPVSFINIGTPIGDVELVRFGERDADGAVLPGRTLIRDVDYTIGGPSSTVTLKEPFESPLKGGEWLQLYFLKARVIAPRVDNGAIIVPTFGAKYVHVTTPSDTNGYLGTSVVGTYTFPSPDSFYTRTVLFTDFLGEVAKIAVSRVAAQNPHGGPIVTSSPSQDNWNFGAIPITSEIRDLLDQDRAARQYISNYNGLIVDFEQVLETIDGRVIGERDGKFRFVIRARNASISLGKKRLKKGQGR
jgi:hypothetical protein